MVACAARADVCPDTPVCAIVNVRLLAYAHGCLGRTVIVSHQAAPDQFARFPRDRANSEVIAVDVLGRHGTALNETATVWGMHCMI